MSKRLKRRARGAKKEAMDAIIGIPMVIFCPGVQTYLNGLENLEVRGEGRGGGGPPIGAEGL